MKYKLSKKKIQTMSIGEQITFCCQSGREFSGIRRYAYKLRDMLKRDDGGSVVISSSQKEMTVSIAVENLALA